MSVTNGRLSKAEAAPFRPLCEAIDPRQSVSG